MSKRYLTMFDKYEDFFKLDFENNTPVDNLIFDATRKDLSYDDESEQLRYLNNSKAILTSELFTCYYFLKQKNLLEEYHKYRNGN